MGDVIDLWSWRKPTRALSKRLAEAAGGFSDKPAHEFQKQTPPKITLPDPDRAIMISYSKAYMQRLSEGMSSIHNPIHLVIDTQHLRFRAPDWLKAQYKDGLPLVIQNVYRNLNVSDIGFFISLSFSAVFVDLFIPFEAITRLVDQRSGLGLEQRKKKEPWSG